MFCPFQNMPFNFIYWFFLIFFSIIHSHLLFNYSLAPTYNSLNNTIRLENIKFASLQIDLMYKPIVIKIRAECRKTYEVLDGVHCLHLRSISIKSNSNLGQYIQGKLAENVSYFTVMFCSVIIWQDVTNVVHIQTSKIKYPN